MSAFGNVTLQNLSNRELLALVTLIFVLFAFGSLYPQLNWPDEPYKFDTLQTSTNIYMKVISRFDDRLCEIAYEVHPKVTNELRVTLLSGFDCYARIKLLHLSFVSLTIILCFFLLNSGFERTVFWGALIWPSTVFYVTGLNQQSIYIVFAVFLSILAIVRGKTLLVIAASLLLVFVDRSALTLFIFSCCMFPFRWRRAWPPLLMLGIVILLNLGLASVGGLTLLTDGTLSISQITQNTSVYADSPLKSLGILFVTFVYAGSTANMFGPGPDYIFVGLLLLLTLHSNIKNIDMYILAFCLFASFFTITEIVPTIQSYRYYPFVAVILLFLNREWRVFTPFYALYCVFFSSVYLILAQLG